MKRGRQAEHQTAHRQEPNGERGLFKARRCFSYTAIYFYWWCFLKVVFGVFFFSPAELIMSVWVEIVIYPILFHTV